MERLHACATKRGRERRVRYKPGELRRSDPVRHARRERPRQPAAPWRRRKCLGENRASPERTLDDTAICLWGRSNHFTCAVVSSRPWAGKTIIGIRFSAPPSGLKRRQKPLLPIFSTRHDTRNSRCLSNRARADAWRFCHPCAAGFSRRSSRLANACRSFAPKAAGPPVSTPLLRRASMKLRRSSNSRMLSLP